MNIDKKVLDYVIEQAAIYDGNNLDIENKTIDNMLELLATLSRQIDKLYINDIKTTLQYQVLINKIQVYVDNMYNNMYKLMMQDIEDHMDKGYADMDDLIEIGHTMLDKLQTQHTQEMKYLVDKNSVDFMKKHAFEQVKGISNDIMQKMRTNISSMLLQGNASIKDIREEISKILDANKSRTITITQTEMSMAYNAGAIDRMNEFNRTSIKKMMKYWYGFKYSDRTCTICRPKIGTIYQANDSTHILPAHPKCRCLWLPYMDGWDTPISNIFTRNTNMINRVYSPDQIYTRINKRLGITYGKYLDINDAAEYLSGDRSEVMKSKIDIARDMAIDDTIAKMDTGTIDLGSEMGSEFKAQMGFWKKYVSRAMVDSKTDIINRSYEAIKGVMILPWTPEQLHQWNKLLLIIKNNM